MAVTYADEIVFLDDANKMLFESAPFATTGHPYVELFDGGSGSANAQSPIIIVETVSSY